ncbi:hypothetical protein BJ165DRAFT_1603181 [Panaeolus papilionaceus]|nr:hypothetical protein BJ165DRAFT_1603181 [Panaeolus papilionaceus]
MHIALIFTFFLSLSSSLVTAIHNSHFARRDLKPRSDVLTSRQHRIRRDLLDICINVNINLLADASKLLGLGSLLGPLGLSSDIQLCLCLKDLDIYLDTNVQIQYLIGLLGRNNVAALVTALINTSPESQQCTFPPHSHHVCSNSGPCHYECDSPYVLQGGLCVCDAPYMSCNGVCGDFPNGCGSAAPRLPGARIKPAINLVQAHRTCKPHESVCGVPGREDTLQFECLDTKSTAASCGGCVTPHPFFDNEASTQGRGVDCTAISHVQHVGCVDRRCVVHSCQPGWIPNSSGKGCTLDSGSSMKREIIGQENHLHVDRRSLPACEASPIDPRLQSQLALLVDLVIDLQGLGNLLGGFTGSPTNSTPTSGSSLSLMSVLGPDLLPAIVQTTGNILSSPTVSSLLGSVSDLLGLSQTAKGLLLQCGCLSNVLSLVEQILQSIMSIQDFCGSNPVPSPAGTPNSHPSTPLSSPLSTTLSYAPSNLPLSFMPSHGDVGTPSSHPTPAPSPSPSANEPSPPLAPGGSEDVPTVVGLTDLLNDLGLASGHSSVTVDGLGNGVDVPVNNLLNGLGIGPLNARQGDSSAAVSAAIGANINLDLSSLLQGVVRLVNNLLSSLGGGVVSATALNPSLVSSVVSSVGGILSSPTVSSLVNNVDSLVTSTRALVHDVDACGCGPGLGSTVDYIIALAESALELQNWCSSHPITSIPSISASLIPSVTSVAHRSPVTSAVPQTPSISSATHHNPTATVPHSSTTHAGAPCVVSGFDGTSNDYPIVVGLDHLLAGLGLTGSTGIVTVDGLRPISNGVNNLLDGLDAGPHGVRRSSSRLDSNATVAVASEVLIEVNALIDLVLNLNSVVAVLPSVPTPPPESSTTLPIPAIDSGDIVNGVVSSAVQLASSATIADLSNAADALGVTCLGYLHLLDTCQCIQQMNLESVYDYLVQIVETSLTLLNLCHAYTESAGGAPTVGPAVSPAPSTMSIQNPGIVAGLTKLLNGLGLPVSAVAEVDGLLDGGLDNFVNNLLDGIGVGPHGVRRSSA